MNKIVPQPKDSYAEQILKGLEALKLKEPAMRARSAANMLDVSEAELLAAQVGAKVVRLKDEFPEILSEVVGLGEVMALTRNEQCVHERKGVYENAQFFSNGKMHHGLFVNPDIDLRLFMSQWKFAFSVIEDAKVGVRHSLQFFDKSGTAIHKIYLTNHSNISAFDDLVERFRAVEQATEIDIELYAPIPAPKDDEDIDLDKFRNAWVNLKDTHDFFPMLRKLGLAREQAFRLIGNDYAYPVDNDASRRVLEMARDDSCEIMVFVGNRGCIQIHTGPVNKLVEHGPWYNVLDPMFNLHLCEDHIASTWVTRKPTVDGDVTAVEVFNQDGEAIVTFFGKRKPGDAELEAWRNIVARLTKKKDANVA